MPLAPAPTEIQEADAAAEALAASIRNGGSPEVSTFNEGAAGSALDDIFKNIGTQVTDPSIEHGLENGGVVNKVEGSPDEPEVVAKPAETVVPPVEPKKPETAVVPEPEKPNLLEEIAGKPTAPVAPVPPADPYGDIKLRSDASQKTQDTFANLKKVALEREAAAVKKAEEAAAARTTVETELAAAKSKLTELEARTATPEVEAELKELRQFRAQFDTERDPEFKSRFDSKVDTNYDAIYSKLTEHALPASELAKLKAMPTAERDAAIENFLSALPTGSRRLIESKLVDNAGLLEARKAALTDARAKADVLLQQKAQESVLAQEKRDTEAAETLRPILNQLEWMHDKPVPATASAADKAALEKHNKFAAEARQHLQTSLIDDSPRVRAQAALAVPVAIHLRHEVISLQTQLAAVQAELDGIRKASQTSRTARTSAAPVSTTKVAAKAPVDSADALDVLFKEASQTGR